MGDENNDSQPKPWFPVRIRDLRVASGRTQREVAESIGVKESTYANAESNRHRRLRMSRVTRLAALYGMDAAQRAELIAGWEAMPESEYSQRNAKSWAARDARRSKLKNHDRLKLALLEVTTLLVTSAADPDTLCACAPVDMFAEQPAGQRTCELCEALRLLGLTGWTNLEDVIAKLAAIQEGMTG